MGLQRFTSGTVRYQSHWNAIQLFRRISTSTVTCSDNKINIGGKEYEKDHMTNITPRILSHIGWNLHSRKYHPLCHIRQRIVNYMYDRFLNPRGNPLFSVFDSINPVVTVDQNFDSLLIPKDHISRKKSDNYYVNQNTLLRAHTSAHQTEFMKMGLDNFIVVGDVYRRDEIDSSHYPVFHQLEGVRLCTEKEVYGNHQDMKKYKLFENVERTAERQGVHHIEAVMYLEKDLKNCLAGLATHLFGKDVEYRWVDAYFPFTHPSWELEVKIEDAWIELLGCGIIEQEILANAAVNDKIGWAFGLGLERWAMKLYSIPDIRLFWSRDSGFLSQFQFEDPTTSVTYKVSLIDSFTHPKTKRTSHCYRIVYRHMERPLSQKEVNVIHKKIEELAAERFKVTIR
ncbi:phenylalanyl-tRNA synthetase, mitochondrial isoform X2 [Oratosquilla oratoria]|uniref:phenylalanyl-tRNA synthetase, mitochondrial isoform X2 n=1 Tax=Oratosquilla oratoria TaxID=337810 RepID=UPI003F76117A